jgi:hypothetical protein
MIIIPKGCHRGLPPQLGIYYNPLRIERRVSFDRSAKYDIGEDQDDVNKLFGIGYFPGHHIDSARFGWNYDLNTGRIRLYAYCYVNRERQIRELCSINIFKDVLLSLDIIDNNYSFTVFDSRNKWKVYGGCDVAFSHKKKLAYRLGVFFGGNRTAPHKIKINIRK